LRQTSLIRFTVEHSIYVRPDRPKNGIGSGLLESLLVITERKGKHAMIGGIDAENNASVRLHQRLGFEYTGRLKEVGFKFGRWLDLLFVQKILSSGTA
jgi:L-amino acid N-acyltransferase YncA